MHSSRIRTAHFFGSMGRGDFCPTPCRQNPPPVDRMTDASENITLLQNSFAGGNKE